MGVSHTAKARTHSPQNVIFWVESPRGPRDVEFIGNVYLSRRRNIIYLIICGLSLQLLKYLGIGSVDLGLYSCSRPCKC